MKIKIKKQIATMLTLTTLLTTTSVYATAYTTQIPVITNQMDVIVNGQRIASDNLLYDSTTYLPIRAISESVGMSVDYNDQQQTVNLKSKGKQKITTKANRGTPTKSIIKALFDSLSVFVDGKEVQGNDIVYNATTYLPLRAVSEATGTKIDYDATNKAVYLTTPDYTPKDTDVTKANNTQKPAKLVDTTVKSVSSSKSSTSGSKGNNNTIGAEGRISIHIGSDGGGELRFHLN